MAFLGLRDGIGLRFHEGAVAAIEMGRYGRTFHLREDVGAPAEEPGAVLPYLPPEASLEMSEARYRGLDPYSGRQLHQHLAGGQRTISILQAQNVLASGLPGVLLARVHMDMSLSAPLTWRLDVGEEAEWESDETGAEVYLGKGCTVRVSATSALVLEDGGHVLSVALPTGVSVVEMWIEAQPALRLAPAIIICTPYQAREAAIVASAVGSSDRAYIPILDLAQPPSTAQEFQAANARLSEMAAQIGQIEEQINTTAQQGAQAPSGLILPGAQAAGRSIEDLTRQREQLLQQMAPVQQAVLDYAAWSRRTSVVTTLLASLTSGSRESAYLFVLSSYPVELLREWAVTAEMTVLVPASASDQLSAWRAAVQQAIPDEQFELVFWKDVQDLSGQVWQRVGRQEQLAFFTIPDEPTFYPLGLLDALRRGRALWPRGRASAQINLAQIQDNLNADNGADHAVIVESDGSIASLVGALYAYHSGARFYVNPSPPVDRALQHMQRITDSVQKEQLAALAASSYRYIGEHRKTFMQSQTADPQLKQVAAGLSVLELPSTIPTPYSDAAFVQALTTYLTAQQAGAVQGYRYDDSAWSKDLAALEAEVMASISEHVRQSVAGVARITVFTSGLPYGLASAWEGKAVGLVLRDVAAPFILRTVAHASVARPALPMALTVDPSLQPQPAPDVPDLVDRTLTLRGPAASLSNLSVLARLLPVDAILLHTQGGVDDIILGDSRSRLAQVHTAELGSQVHLPSHPIVIYAAPLAWLGVGGALLEQGAGGFLGALWPLSNGAADDAIRAVLRGAVAQGENPAEALRRLPGYDRRTSRAFIYLGSAAAWPAASHNTVEGTATLYAMAARLAAIGRSEMATMVYDRLRALTGEIALGNPSLRAELLLLDADFQTRLISRQRERPAQEVVEKVWRSLDTIEEMSLPEQHKKALQIAIWERSALLEMAAESYARAQELLQAVRDARHARGETTGDLSAGYLLAVVQERQRQWAAARQTLLDLQSDLATVGNGLGLVRVASSLAYVSLPLAMYPDVLSHLKLAVQTGLALGVQILSEVLVETLAVTKAMAQMGASADLLAIAHALADVVNKDQRLPDADRTAIVSVFTLITEVAQVLQAGLSAEERESKLAPLVERAQSNDFLRSLGMDAWILGAGSPRQAAAETG